jgi:hypothetical protein
MCPGHALDAAGPGRRAGGATTLPEGGTVTQAPPLALAPRSRTNTNTSSGDCDRVVIEERPRHTLAGSAGYRRARTSVTQLELTQAGQSDG